ncbi:MAG: large subunit ribosomal protein [Clostridia bacterium]|jgi:large subunit ribosomal protein L25|nr:large subunit ribosomal protein [Clostridia bacterium]MDN5321644.1 large subunit ribosomal protein [Clostridia bacterium]
MKSINLELTKRNTSLGKGALNRMRKEGVLPAVVYGKKVGTVPVSVVKKDLIGILNNHGTNAILNLIIAGKPIQAMIKEIQSHPVTGHYWHVDFAEISLDQEIRTEVQINFTGEPQGIKEGGIIQYGDTTVEIECLPEDIPGSFTMDISKLKIGDKLTVGDIKTENNVKILSEPEQILISVIPPVMDDEDEEVDKVDETGEEKPEVAGKE